jgi:hypothetical protein
MEITKEDWIKWYKHKSNKEIMIEKYEEEDNKKDGCPTPNKMGNT